MLNAVTLAAGGLSGGLSSSIAGGSFWSGARQGLITSGLNHVAHAGTRKWIERGWIMKQLRDAGYNRKRIKESLLSLDKTGRESLILELMGRVKNMRLLEGLYKEGKFSINVTMGEDPYGDNALARTPIADIDNQLGSHATIDFYNKTFRNLFTLARVIHHEGIHVQHHISGKTHLWFNSALGKNISRNTAIDYAYSISDYYANISTYYAIGSIKHQNQSKLWLDRANNICSTCLR